MPHTIGKVNMRAWGLYSRVKLQRSVWQKQQMLVQQLAGVNKVCARSIAAGKLADDVCQVYVWL